MYRQLMEFIEAEGELPIRCGVFQVVLTVPMVCVGCYSLQNDVIGWIVWCLLSALAIGLPIVRVRLNNTYTWRYRLHIVDLAVSLAMLAELVLLLSKFDSLTAFSLGGGGLVIMARAMFPDVWHCRSCHAWIAHNDLCYKDEMYSLLYKDYRWRRTIVIPIIAVLAGIGVSVVMFLKMDMTQEVSWVLFTMFLWLTRAMNQTSVAFSTLKLVWLRKGDPHPDDVTA